VLIRPATLDDLPAIVAIQNHYILNTHITFDVEPVTPKQRVKWFHEHNDGGRYRLLLAESENTILGYACTGRFRDKAAYDTTVEVSIACDPGATGKGIGRELYAELFGLIKDEDIHLLAAGIAQPNAVSNALHKRFGFQPVGTFTRVGRKFGKYCDVLWMEKLL
jgi:phosphinothricin acetyltransferase